MKKTLFFYIVGTALTISLFAGCASTPAQTAAPVEPVITVEPELPEEPAPTPQDEEYLRSVNQIAISLEEFTEDKARILEIISQLDTIMKRKNYNQWLNYLDKESITYWSKSANLQKAETRLPVKGLRLSTLEDYFTLIFIPARVGKRVDEIRYETETEVKAVQVNDSNDTVYYNFQKVDGEWKVHLPALTD